MRACCCSLAGTRACDNCRNGPSRSLFQPIVIQREEFPEFWSTSLSSDINEKAKNKKNK